MKKLFLLIMSTVLIFTLAACGAAPKAAHSAVPTAAEADPIQRADWEYANDRGWEAFYEGDFDTAIEWFSQAAESGEPAYIHSLGDAYAQAGDYESALDCYRQIVDLGDSSGYLYIGRMYAVHVKDFETAVEWLKKGAELDNPSCMRELGRMYEYGQGVEQNDKAAQEWYRRADEAEQP